MCSLVVIFAGDDVVDAFVVTGGSGVSDPGGIRLLVALSGEVVELVSNTTGATAVDVISEDVTDRVDDSDCRAPTDFISEETSVEAATDWDVSGGDRLVDATLWG